MALTEIELQKLKDAEFSILEAFDEYCCSNDLRYYLIGGALLGSARYGDFIPWDDDIDVAMPREDYERLYTLWQKNPKVGLFLQRAETDPMFSRCITKIRKENTEIIEAISQNAKINHGIYIDIFPIDYVPEINEKKLAKKASKIRKLMSLRAIRGGYVEGRKSRIKKILKIFVDLLPYKIIDAKIYKECTELNSESKNYAIIWVHNYAWNRQLHDIDVFGDSGECIFRSKSFKAPKKIDVFLKKVFGDNYMEEPPIDKRVTPHRYLSVNF